MEDNHAFRTCCNISALISYDSCILMNVYTSILCCCQQETLMLVKSTSTKHLESYGDVRALLAYVWLTITAQSGTIELTACVYAQQPFTCTPVRPT